MLSKWLQISLGKNLNKKLRKKLRFIKRIVLFHLFLFLCIACAYRPCSVFNDHALLAETVVYLYSPACNHQILKHLS